MEQYLTLLANYYRETDNQEHLLKSIFTTEHLKLSWSIVRSIWQRGPVQDVYNSHDKAIVEFRSVDNADSSGPKRKDEVANYLESRYLSATKSCYRIFAFGLHAKYRM